MNDKTALVFNGFLKLTTNEQAELIEAINDYLKKDTLEKGDISESFKQRSKRIVGPTSSIVCSCCGK